jgi:hypothetical protein
MKKSKNIEKNRANTKKYVNMYICVRPRDEERAR